MEFGDKIFNLIRWKVIWVECEVFVLHIVVHAYYYHHGAITVSAKG